MNDSADSPISSSDESHERDLNRHRVDEQRRARAEMAERLHERGIVLDERDSLEDVVELIDSVEAFERAVEARGGDLMVDTPPARQPDNSRFVLPLRLRGESLTAYTGRVRDASRSISVRRAD